MQSEDIERRYGIRLPEDFKTYLDTRAPSEDFWDDANFVWWSAARVKSLTEECGRDTPDEQRNNEIEEEATRYLVFADYLDWCYAYALCCSEGPNRGKVALIGGRPDRFVA